MRELTDRQMEILLYIREYRKMYKYPPSYRDIGRHFGISVKGVSDHITALRNKGAITIEPHKPRTIVVVLGSVV